MMTAVSTIHARVVLGWELTVLRTFSLQRMNDSYRHNLWVEVSTNGPNDQVPSGPLSAVGQVGTTATLGQRLTVSSARQGSLLASAPEGSPPTCVEAACASLCVVKGEGTSPMP
jgi:hypothetical protein